MHVAGLLPVCRTKPHASDKAVSSAFFRSRRHVPSVSDFLCGRCFSDCSKRLPSASVDDAYGAAFLSNEIIVVLLTRNSVAYGGFLLSVALGPLRRLSILALTFTIRFLGVGRTLALAFQDFVGGRLETTCALVIPRPFTLPESGVVGIDEGQGRHDCKTENEQ